MKKLTALVLAILMAVSCLSVIASAEVTPGSPEEASLMSASLLPNVYAKMRAGEDIHVGYFGGSVTNGYGATNQAGTSWRGLSLKWLNDTYASTYGCSFYEGTHAGLGGSGTDLNVYRADSALGLDGSDPVDLLFIEFAVNDSYEGNSYEKSAYYLESIIRKVRTKAPECDIVVCLTYDFGKKDTEYTNAKAHADVAAYYSIPTMWFGKRMWAFLTQENGGTPLTSQTSALWLQYYQDGCHPNDNGYAKYYEFLRDDILKPNLDTNASFSTTVTNHTMPSTYYSSQLSASSEYYNKTPNVDAYNVVAGAASGSDKYYNFTGTTTLSALSGGASFTAVFHSKSAGIYYQGDPTNGLILYSVDGGDYQVKNLYTSASATNEYFMFYQDLPYGEHTVNVILRKTENGSDLKLRAFFIDGDSAKSGVTITGAPNQMPLTDVYYHQVILTPDLLNTKISSTNTGSTFSVLHHHTDVDVLQYVPNPSSGSDVASDCWNNTFRTVALPRYGYAIMHYYYEMGAGDTQHATRPLLRMLQLPNSSSSSFMLYSADELVLDQSSEALFDLTALGYRFGANGNLKQMHVFPYGYLQGNKLSATELMNIRDITFYAEWPNDKTVAVDAGDLSLNSTAKTLSLAGKKVLPSAYPYAKITYSYNGSTAGNIALDFTNLNYGPDIHVESKAITNGTDNTVVANLTPLAHSGQIYYLDDVKLSAATGSGETLTVSQIDFCSEYPDKNAQFSVSFDANGASGVAPSPITDKIGTLIALPNGSALSKPGYTFLGWNTDPAATTVLSSYYIQEDDTTLYAIFAELNTVYANADGSGTLTYQGVSHTAYNTVKAAVQALGTSGGQIIFAGRHDLNAAISAQNANAPLIVFKGADSTAELLCTNATVKPLCNTTFENTKIIKGRNSANTGVLDVYFNCNGKQVTIGAADASDDVFMYNLNADDTLTQSVFKLYGTSTTTAPGNVVINSGKYNILCADGYNNASTGNTYITINGGTFDQAVAGGGLGFKGDSAPQTMVHIGNINVIINGGTFTRKDVRLSYNANNATTVTGGKATAILNNGMATTQSLSTSGFNYVIKSTKGGMVSIASEATGDTAPTFVIVMDDPEMYAYVDGVMLDNDGGKSYFTPTADGTYNITYTRKKYTVSFDLNGGSGTVPPSITDYAEEVVSLPDGSGFSKDDFAFAGWSQTATSPVAVADPYTIPASNITLYAIWTLENAAFANADGSGTILYQGETYPAYTTLAEAITSLGANGGLIIIAGEHNLKNAITASNANAPYYRIRGLDDTAVLATGDTLYTFKTTTYLENVSLKGDGDNYMLFGNTSKTVTLTLGAEGAATDIQHFNASNAAKSTRVLGTSGAKTGNIVINAGTYSFLAGAYSTASKTGNTNITVNGGTINCDIIGGTYSFSNGTFTHNGNITVTLNGGTYKANQNVLVSQNASRVSVATGKTTVILNNGLAQQYNFATSEYDYTITSTADGFATLTAEGSADTAPTFTFTANDATDTVFVNGTAIPTTAGVATFTPEANGTYAVAYAKQEVTVDFDVNGATGSTPPSITGFTGAEAALPSGSGLTKDGYTFRGWSESATNAADIVADPYPMPAENLTLYAQFVPNGVAFANADASGKIVYQGVTYPAVDTLAAAITSLGNAGGSVVFTGSHVFKEDVADAVKTAAPFYKLIGADDNAILEISKDYSYYQIFKADFYLEHLTMVAPKSGGKYIMPNNGKSLTIGSIDPATGLGANDVQIVTADNENPLQVFLAGNPGWGATGDFTINSGRYEKVSGTYGNASGNTHVTINGGTMPSAIVVGAAKVSGTGAYTHNGNITFTLNGGTYNATQYVQLSENSNRTTTVTGKTSVILNNGLASAYNFVFTQIDYVLKSAAGGKAALATEGSATTAPTFTLTADDPTMVVYVDGAPIATTAGVATFTPADTGVFEITYQTVNAFTDSVIAKAGYVAETSGSADKTYAILASVQLADWVDPATIASIGFYGYTADSETARVTLANAATIATLSTNDNRFYCAIYDIPTDATEVVLKPFVAFSDTAYTGSAGSYVPATLGASTYYGPESAVTSYFN